jgi:hypothetical protein
MPQISLLLGGFATLDLRVEIGRQALARLVEQLIGAEQLIEIIAQ